MAQYVVTQQNVFVVDAYLIGPDAENFVGIRPLTDWVQPDCSNDPFYGERPLPTPGKPTLRFK